MGSILFSLLTAGILSACGSFDNCDYPKKLACESMTQNVSQLSEAIVLIDVRRNQARDTFGTGFISDSEGTIITSDHVTDKADKIIVNIDGFDVEYKIVQSAGRSSISVLKPKVKMETQNFVSKYSSSYAVGEQVFTIGYPLGLAKLFTNGYVSGYTKDHVILNMPTYPGMSGSPLFNCKGEIIGFLLAVHSEARTIGIANKSTDLIKLKDVAMK